MSRIKFSQIAKCERKGHFWTFTDEVVMRTLRVLICFCAAMLLLVNDSLAAQSSADIPLMENQAKEARDRILGDAKIPSTDPYVIGIGDILGVEVYGEGDMSIGGSVAAREGEETPLSGASGAQVRIDGRVSLRHIGDIEAVGFTLPQFANYLKELYASVFDNPIVTVVLKQSNSKRYTVMGKVGKPGIYYIDSPIDIVQAIARCGGFAEWSNGELRLIRKNPQKSKELFTGNALIFDYDDFLDGKHLEKNVLLEDGDIMIVN
jgi:polysaccharide export outer membrane protein